MPIPGLDKMERAGGYSEERNDRSSFCLRAPLRVGFDVAVLRRLSPRRASKLESNKDMIKGGFAHVFSASSADSAVNIYTTTEQ